MLNVASLTKHLDEIRLLLHDKKIDILALNETRLDSSISDEPVAIDGYDLIRSSEASPTFGHANANFSVFLIV